MKKILMVILAIIASRVSGVELPSTIIPLLCFLGVMKAPWQSVAAGLLISEVMIGAGVMSPIILSMFFGFFLLCKNLKEFSITACLAFMGTFFIVTNAVWGLMFVDSAVAGLISGISMLPKQLITLAIISIAASITICKLELLKA